MSELPPLFADSSSALAHILHHSLPQFQQAADWQTTYRLLMQLGKQLPSFSVTEQCDDTLISGCESKAWLHHYFSAEQARHYWAFDSETRIIKGTVALVLCQFNGRTQAEIAQYTFSELLKDVGVQQQLSPSRQNGLQAVLATIAAQAGVTLS